MLGTSYVIVLILAGSAVTGQNTAVLLGDSNSNSGIASDMQCDFQKWTILRKTF